MGCVLLLSLLGCILAGNGGESAESVLTVVDVAYGF